MTKTDIDSGDISSMLGVSRRFLFFPPLFPENPSEPFGASVIIDGVTYGAGTASSKKLAKNKAGNVFSFSGPSAELFLLFVPFWGSEGHSDSGQGFGCKN